MQTDPNIEQYLRDISFALLRIETEMAVYHKMVKEQIDGNKVRPEDIDDLVSDRIGMLKESYTFLKGV